MIAEETVGQRNAPDGKDADGQLTFSTRVVKTFQWFFRSGFVAIILGLIVWQLVVMAFDIRELILPAPTAIAQAYADLWRSGQIQHDTWVSAKQVAVGYTMAAVAGVTFGLMIGQFRLFRNVFEPWVVALYTMPNIALAPLFIVWLGFGFTAKAVVIAFVAFFPIVLNTVGGVENLRAEWIDVSSAFKVTKMERFFKVSLPGALPSIFTGLRLGVGRGVVAIVLADFFGAKDGLGFFLLRSAQNFRTANLFVGIITLASFGLVLTALLRFLEFAVSPSRKIAS